MVFTKKGYLTYESENKSVRSAFFHESLSVKRLQITLNGETIEHAKLPQDIIKEIESLGGKVVKIYNSKPRHSVFGIPVEVTNVKKLKKVRVRVVGNTHEEIIAKITKIQKELMRFGVKYVTCNWDSVGLYPEKT